MANDYCLNSWSVRLSVGRSVGWLVGRFADRQVGRFDVSSIFPLHILEQ